MNARPAQGIPSAPEAAQNEGVPKRVSVRELRNHGGRVLDRVLRGETLEVTKDGSLVAELHPPPRRSLPTAELIARARRAPKVDPERLRRDVDAIVDQAL